MDTHLVCTIGHSTRPIDEFIGLLKLHEVQCVLDIRTVPKSRHNPQFNRDNLPASLEAAGIGYRHIAGLGGLRHARADSPNGGWRNASFRGYADYMQTAEFIDNIDELVDLARASRCVLMCAESVPWRCHRSMVADALVVRGVPVEHIITGAKRKPHVLTPFAVVEGSRISYPPQPQGSDPVLLSGSDPGVADAEIPGSHNLTQK
ncbi:MAG: DUF488 domain-containing protein [Telluria sp.]